MLTQPCRIVFGQEASSDALQVSTFEIGYSNKLAASTPGDSIHWQPVDVERFTLVANETVKIGQPVNRNDADYWISQFTRLGAVGEGERVGRVKVR